MTEVFEALPVQKGPSAIQVVESLEEQHKLRLDLQALQSILLNPDVVDKKVSVISVAGTPRKGKSFLLNFFLRYLSASEEARRSGDWFYADENLKGFNWRGGFESETTGILLWSQPFLLRNSSGEEIAVILMDTHGTFDNQSTVKDCATIFALSTLISSLQIYNLSNNVQEDDLQHLRLFTEYGWLALTDKTAQPFQSLLFLVRDWLNSHQYYFGFEDGNRFIRRCLTPSAKQNIQMQTLRSDIKSSFERLSCFLMPFPGKTVASNADFHGNIRDSDSDFQENLRFLISYLLDSNNLVLKKVSGREITCHELADYFKVYVQIFQGSDLPEPKDVILDTAQLGIASAKQESLTYYITNMMKICDGDTPYRTLDDLVVGHKNFREKAVNLFKKKKKVGDNEMSSLFLKNLENEMEDEYKRFVLQNEFREKSFMAEVEKQNHKAFLKAKVHYEQSMAEACKVCKNSADLSADHERCSKEALRLFKESKEINNTEISGRYFQILTNDIKEKYKQLVTVNEHKKSGFLAQVERNCITAKLGALDVYTNGMHSCTELSTKRAILGGAPHIESEDLFERHQRCVDSAVKRFEELDNSSNFECFERYKEELLKEIREQYKIFCEEDIKTKSSYMAKLDLDCHNAYVSAKRFYREKMRFEKSKYPIVRVFAQEKEHEACKNDAILRYEEDAKKEARSYETKREELIAHIEEKYKGLREIAMKECTIL